ncbi:histidine phosphatase family protein [Salinibius halmophilus]|uniref:histidine phosphatase family protein n=1 Tax=Salinibius halmophilus TaxID=1853216 RepID=UPI000E66B973|nr:histidine phosphatase family protein [Salinibius halmophilus]
MARIHIFRHGQTQWNLEGRLQGQADSPLTELGQQQAIEAREKIAGIQFDHFICSTANRTKQTIDILHPEHTNLEHNAGISEMHFGDWEGMKMADLAAAHELDYKYLFHQPEFFTSPNGENFDELTSRGIKTLASIVLAHKGKEVLVVSHAAWIKATLTRLIGKSISHIWDEPFAHNLSHSVVELHRGQMFITQFCDQPWSQPGR